MEIVSVYHMVDENQSFRSADCNSWIIKNVYGNNSKYSCARTKSEAILKGIVDFILKCVLIINSKICLTGVLAPFAMETVSKDLEQVRFVALAGDASNHGNIKMFPVVARYFSLTNGVEHKVLNFVDIPDETANTIIELLDSVCEKFDLEKKLASFSADNASLNFGGVTRGGNVNVFHQLQTKYDDRLIGVGCNAHLLHNTIQNACNALDVFNIEAMVVKIYKYFYRNTVRVTRLKEICDSSNIEYLRLLEYGKTRFLAMKKCIERIIAMFDVLKSFFLNPQEKNVSEKLIQFFNAPIAKLLLIFVHDECELFEGTITQLEGDHVAGFEAFGTVNKLKNIIQAQADDHYRSYEFREENRTIKENLPFRMTLKDKKGTAVETCIDQHYIDQLIKKFRGRSMFFIFKKQLFCYSIIVSFYNRRHNWILDQMDAMAVFARKMGMGCNANNAIMGCGREVC